MAKNLTLSADEAAKFWPLYQQIQKDQTAIVDAQLAATQKYAVNFRTLRDTDALAYIKAWASSCKYDSRSSCR